MVRPKAAAKKQQKRGVDFKKIKRKIGRKLPPPNNATNTEIKSKAIILPEQSVASEKLGLAVSKKGLTLKELLQQTSHHNAKVRKDALIGIRELLHKYPTELSLHKLAIIEKLRERISDEDKVVRETLYQLLKSVIFPGSKAENQGPFISLMMAYIFNAMTHLAIEVRLMAFKFFDLVVQHYPSSFSLYAEKILENYEDILRRNQFYLQDKGKLKNALAGLVRCLSLLPGNEREAESSSEKNFTAQGILHAYEPDVPKDPTGFNSIMEKLKGLILVLVKSFQEFIPLINTTSLFDAQSFECMLSILQSIDLTLHFFISGIEKYQPDLPVSLPPCGSHMRMISHMFPPSILKKLLDAFPLNAMHHLSEKDDDRYFILNIVITKVFLRLGEWLGPSFLADKFMEFVENALSGKICNEKRSGKAFRERHLVSLIPYVPKLISAVTRDWKSRLLQAFTTAFSGCNPESALKVACLSAIQEMLIPEKMAMNEDGSDPEILGHQISWIRDLPSLLILLGDMHPSCSKIILQLQLRLGQCAMVNPSLAQEYDNIQYSLQEFYSIAIDERTMCYGPFIKLPRDCQELAICCLYYFSYLDSQLLKSLASCCLGNDVEPYVLFRIIEVLHSAYRSGHIQIADHISFFITLLSRFKVFPEKIYPITKNNKRTSNRGIFKSISNVVCTCLSQMGDGFLVLNMVEEVIAHQISLKPPLDNACAILRMLIVLDSKPTRLSEESITILSEFIPGYMIDVASCLSEDEEGPSVSSSIRTCHYYLTPVFFLFDRSAHLLNLVLKMWRSLITANSSSSLSDSSAKYASDHSSRINAIVSVLSLMCKDAKSQRILSSCREEMDTFLQNLLLFQGSEEVNMSIEERHTVKCASDRLQILTSTLSSVKPSTLKIHCT